VLSCFAPFHTAGMLEQWNDGIMEELEEWKIGMLE
jgi:hypothetical protein